MTEQTNRQGDHAVDRWLQSQGFYFNPFSQLDAAADPYLDHYLVQHEAFHAVWGDWHTFIFEPAGGGKTALRVRTVHACHIGQETNRPFPISYLPPFLQWGHVQPTLTEHLRAIISSGASQLLFSLAHRPHWFLRLAQPEQRAIRMLLEWGLPGPLNGYLSLMAAGGQTGQLTLLRRRLQLSPYLPIAPNEELLREFRQTLEATTGERSQPTVQEQWQFLQQVIQEILQFPSIFLLLDGLDTTRETADQPQILADVCHPLWEELAKWQTERLFVKAFLPRNAQRAIETAQPTLTTPIRTAGIHWQADLLIEMLAQRVDFATRGQSASLNVLAAPDLAGLEEQLVAAIQPLPRNLLLLTNEMIRCHVERNSGSERLTQQDFGAALATYQAQARA